MARISQWLDPLIAPSPKSSASAPKVSQSPTVAPVNMARMDRGAFDLERILKIEPEYLDEDDHEHG